MNRLRIEEGEEGSWGLTCTQGYNVGIRLLCLLLGLSFVATRLWLPRHSGCQMLGMTA